MTDAELQEWVESHIDYIASLSEKRYVRERPRIAKLIIAKVKGL